MEFQHAELLKARDKIKVIGQQTTEAATVRTQYLARTQDLLHQRRNGLQALEKRVQVDSTMMPMDQQIKSLQIDITTGVVAELLPKLFQEKTVQLVTNTERLEKENDLLESLVSQLQGTNNNKNTVIAMIQDKENNTAVVPNQQITTAPPPQDAKMQRVLKDAMTLAE